MFELIYANVGDKSALKRWLIEMNIFVEFGVPGRVYRDGSSKYGPCTQLLI